MKYNAIYFQHTIVSVIVLLLQLGIAKAQGPYTYDTPNGTDLIYSTALSGKRIILDPWRWNAPSANMDGIEISLRVNMNADIKSKLFTFFNSNGRQYLEVFYQDKTLLFRRYLNEQTFYDYKLLDPLFVLPPGGTAGSWTVKLYFTGNFFWIQTQLSSAGTRYLSPLFYGVNVLDRSNMDDILYGMPNTSIVVGDSQNVDFSLSATLSVYAFKYSILRDDIQQYFCNTAYNRESGGLLEDGDPF